MSDKANRELHRKAAQGDERAQQALKRAQQRSCSHDWRGVYWASRFQGTTLCITKCDKCELEGESTLAELAAICAANNGCAWEWRDSYFCHPEDALADLFQCKRCGKEKERVQ